MRKSQKEKDIQYWINTGQVRKSGGSTSSSSTSFNYSSAKSDYGGNKKLDYKDKSLATERRGCGCWKSNRK